MTTTPCQVCDSRDFRRLGEKADHTFVKCRTCGLERIDPPPTDEVLAKVYGEHYYDAWGLKADEDAVARLKRSTFRRVVGGAGRLPKGSKVLDCGAATGFLMQVAKDDFGYDPYGVELSEYGAKKIADTFGEGHVFCGEIADAHLPGIKDGDFRAIFMCDYIEHVRDPAAVLARAYQMLAPGGVLGISTPRVDSLTHRTMGMGWTHYKVEHLYYFSDDSLARLLRKVGFSGYRAHGQWKTMNLKYMTHQFAVYPHGLLTHVINATMKVVPRRAQTAPFPIMMGELVAYATKP